VTGARTSSWGPQWAGWLRRVPLVVAAYVGVKYFRGMDSVVRVHDHLDHLQAVYSRMSLADLFGSPGSDLDFTLGGLPRSFIGSEFSLGTIVAVALPLVLGLIVGEVVYRAIAYYGMVRLLSRVGFDDHPWVVVAAASLFSIAPFYHPGFASVAGVPLLLSALIGLHREPSRFDWVVVALFPLVGMPQATIPYAALLVGYALIAIRFVPRRVLAGAGLFTGTLLASEWRQVLGLFTAPDSNRLAFTPRGDAALSTEVFSLGRVGLETVEKHAAHAYPFLIPAVFAIGLVVLLASVTRWKPPSRPDQVLWAALIAMAGVVVVAAAWPILDEQVIRPLVGEYPRIQIDRVVWLLPGLGFAAVAAVAAALVEWTGRRMRWAGIVVVSALLATQGVALWQQADFSRPPLAQLTIDEFYAPDLFAEVSTIVEDDGGGPVVTVGFDPSVALYNGMDTAGGAWFSYPLEYKNRWRALIAPALEADPEINDYFEGYGNRVYVFQPDFGISFCCEIQHVDTYELLVDPAAFVDLEISHVLSNGVISNAAELGLEAVSTLEGDGDGYRITVYRT